MKCNFVLMLSDETSLGRISVMGKIGRLIASVALAGLIFAGVSSIARAEPAQKLPSPALLQGLLGGKISAEDLKNKIVVYQFFASWCVGCEKTMHDMMELTKDRKEVLYVPVSVDEDVKSARSFFSNKSESIKSLESKSFVDPTTDFAARMNIKAVPSIVVTGSDGSVLTHTSGHPTQESIKEFKAAMDKGARLPGPGASH